MDKNTNNDGKNLPKKQSQLPSKKKIHPLSKDAAEFLANLEKKKAGPSEIANLLEQWLDNE